MLHLASTYGLQLQYVEFLTILMCMYFSSGFPLLTIDQFDIDLRHSLANLVGTVLGCPSTSNHLWYHLFHTEKLPGTYMTGYMVLYGYQKVRL